MIKEFYYYYRILTSEAYKSFVIRHPEEAAIYHQYDITDKGFLPSESNLKFLLTASRVEYGWLNLINNLNKLKDPGTQVRDVFKAYIKPQMENMKPLQNQIITESDVCKHFTVDSSSKQNLMNERNPNGVSTFLRYALQHTDTLSNLNQIYGKFNLPTDVVTTFSSQQRGNSPVTTTYEDIYAEEREENERSRKIALHIKNSTETNHLRLLEDALKTIFSIEDPCDTIFLSITIFHPEDVASKGSSIFNEMVIKRIQRLGGGVGIINFGLYTGPKDVRRLGETYSAIKWARMQMNSKQYLEDGQNKDSWYALEKLNAHGVCDVKLFKLEEMSCVFEDIINPRAISGDEFLQFFIRYLECYGDRLIKKVKKEEKYF